MEIGLGLGQLLGGDRAAGVFDLDETGFGFGGSGWAMSASASSERSRTSTWPGLTGRSRTVTSSTVAASGLPMEILRRRGDASGGDDRLGERRLAHGHHIHFATLRPQQHGRQRAGGDQRHDQLAARHAGLAGRKAEEVGRRGRRASVKDQTRGTGRRCA